MLEKLSFLGKNSVLVALTATVKWLPFAQCCGHETEERECFPRETQVSQDLDLDSLRSTIRWYRDASLLELVLAAAQIMGDERKTHKL